MVWRLRTEQLNAIRKERIANGLARRLGRQGYTTAYDPRTSVLRATDAMSRTTTYQLGSEGFVEAVRTAAGRLTQLRIDSRGDVIQVVEPSGRTTDLTYASTGAPTSFARNGTLLPTQPGGPAGSLLGRTLFGPSWGFSSRTHRCRSLDGASICTSPPHRSRRSRNGRRCVRCR